MIVISLVVFALPLSVVGQNSLYPLEQQEQEEVQQEQEDETNHVLIGSLTAEQVEQRRAERGIIDLSEVFLPKGTWIFGGSASFSTSTFNNYSIVLIEGITSDNYTFEVTPSAFYALWDNMAVGARVKYGRSNYTIDSAAVNISMGDSNVSLTMEDYRALSHNYSFVAIFRQYIPLGSDKRFALFNDFQIEAGGFQSRFVMGSPVTGTFSKGWNLGVGITPGIVAFATNRVAFDVSVGVLGVSYVKGEQVHNQVSIGEYNSSVMSFAINIFSVSMGVSVYL
ncbi:MAG: hypothetical protein SNG96_03075 [Rikenellaceae bacterium]